MKIKIIISALIVLMMASAASAALVAPTTNHVGAKISGYYWDLMGWTGIHNGSLSKIYTITFQNNGTPAASDTNNATIYYNSTAGKLKLSENGSAYADLNRNSTYEKYQGSMDAMNTSAATNDTASQSRDDSINTSITANVTYFNGSAFPNSTSFRNDTLTAKEATWDAKLTATNGNVSANITVPAYILIPDCTVALAINYSVCGNVTSRALNWYIESAWYNATGVAV